jgi:hypothetical protein
MKKILEKIYVKFAFPVLREIGRPKDIPLIAPDCGWNHGEQKNDVKKITDNGHGHSA